MVVVLQLLVDDEIVAAKVDNAEVFRVQVFVVVIDPPSIVTDSIEAVTDPTEVVTKAATGVGIIAFVDAFKVGSYVGSNCRRWCWLMICSIRRCSNRSWCRDCKSQSGGKRRGWRRDGTKSPRVGQASGLASGWN
jgi:hypothetical protein